jgi:hypothetical protein
VCKQRLEESQRQRGTRNDSVASNWTVDNKQRGELASVDPEIAQALQAYVNEQVT